jgi:DNA-directed RNA polymerase subunit F
MSIQIEGLNKRQRAIADVLWLMKTKEDALRFIASLEPQTRKDAETVIEMMQLAVIDECDSIDDSVKSIIDNLK